MVRNKAKGIDFKGLRVIYIGSRIEKRLEETHEKMQPYTFSLAPCPDLEPTLF